MPNPEKYTEAFFTEVKGWKWREMGDALPGNFQWHAGPAEKGFKLPPIHESLDLQEEWLWPELFKMHFICCDIDFDPDKKIYKILMLGPGIKEFRAFAPTKALAQLIAGCKALGIKVEKL